MAKVPDDVFFATIAELHARLKAKEFSSQELTRAFLDRFVQFVNVTLKGVTQPELVRHQIGFISANTAVYDRMTAWEMVQYFGRLYGMDEVELRERMEVLFDRLQMQEIRDQLGAKMSTGMKQKVSIARAIVHDPPVLIFDEATTGLDVLVARALLDAVAELRDQGKCIVFSTHILREAERLCDRIAIMYRGRILAEGTLEELRDKHEERDLEELFFQLIRRRQVEEMEMAGK